MEFGIWKEVSPLLVDSNFRYDYLNANKNDLNPQNPEQEI
jgi:hypothetical protein